MGYYARILSFNLVCATIHFVKKLLIIIFGLLLCIPSTYASVESLQIVNFQWDTVNKKLVPFSFGSGTAIQKNLVLTNKHVVTKQGGKVADFLLLCQAQHKSTRGVVCDIPAGVVSIHDKFDAALIRTLDKNDFLPHVRTAYYRKGTGDGVRLEGFPLPLGEYQNFGSSITKENILKWTKNGGVLELGGDKLTITRGKVTMEGIFNATGGHYLFTNAKVNFGNSGGAAFDTFGNYIGIPTLKDKNYNAIILTYNQLRPWMAEVYKNSPVVPKEALEYYQEIAGKSVQQVRSSRSSRSNRIPISSRALSSFSSSKASSRTAFRQNYFRGGRSISRRNSAVANSKNYKRSAEGGRYRPFSGGYYRRSR